MVTFKLNLHYVHNLKIPQNCTPKDSTKQTNKCVHHTTVAYTCNPSSQKAETGGTL